jgi:hypothetical protein
MTDSLSTTSGNEEERLWDTVELTVEAIAYDGLAQGAVLLTHVPSQDEDATKQLIGNVKRLVRTVAGSGPWGFGFAVKPNTDCTRLVHVVSKHFVVPADTWAVAARLGDFEIETLHTVNGSAYQETRDMLELPLRKADSSERMWANRLEHLTLNDYHWVPTVGAFWWDRGRKLTGITQAREAARLRLDPPPTGGGEIAPGER